MLYSFLINLCTILNIVIALTILHCLLCNFILETISIFLLAEHFPSMMVTPPVTYMCCNFHKHFPLLSMQVPAVCLDAIHTSQLCTQNSFFFIILWKILQNCNYSI